MDIAAFVGFARNGPLDTPVAIEDSARFREIFEDDIALAWDAERGGYRYSYLGAAVDAFFKNGGRRCWVVRVADKATAVTHQFHLPGLICISDGSIAEPDAHVSARSPGSWARLMRVGTALDTTQLYPDTSSNQSILELGDSAWSARLSALPKPMFAGDLLEVGFEHTTARLILVVAKIETDVAQGIRLSGQSGYWLYQNFSPSPPVAGLIESSDHEYQIYPLTSSADL